MNMGQERMLPLKVTVISNLEITRIEVYLDLCMNLDNPNR